MCEVNHVCVGLDTICEACTLFATTMAYVSPLFVGVLGLNYPWLFRPLRTTATPTPDVNMNEIEVRCNDFVSRFHSLDRGRSPVYHPFLFGVGAGDAMNPDAQA